LDVKQLTFWYEDATLEIETSSDRLVQRFKGPYDGPAVHALFAQAADVVRQPGSQWYALSDFSDMSVRVRDPSIVKFVIEHTRLNAPFVARSAAVVRKDSLFLFLAQRVFTSAKRSIPIFGTLDEARGYLDGAH